MRHEHQHLKKHEFRNTPTEMDKEANYEQSK